MYVCVVTIRNSKTVVLNGMHVESLGQGCLEHVRQGAIRFYEESKILLGKIVWSSFRWLLVACSTWMYKLSIVFRCAPFFW